MEKSINNVVANLYGLRAGLSVMAQECDKIRGVEAEVNRRNNLIEQRLRHQKDLKLTQENVIEKNENQVKESKPDRVRFVVFFFLMLAACIAFSVAFIKMRDKYADTFNFMAIVCGLVMGTALICITLLIGMWVCCWFSGWNSLIDKIFDYSEFWLYIVYIAAIICGIATVPLFVINGVGKHGVGYCGLLFVGIFFSAVFVLINFIRFIINFSGYAGNKSQIRKAKSEIRRLEKAEKDMAPAFAQERAKTAAWRVQSLTPLVKNIFNMYAVLRSVYQPVLDERDWRHLDLVIYELETRRADTIKEALQLVDRELQTRRIENLVYNATKTIVGTLNEGFSMLRSSLTVVYNGLSAQLSGLSGQLSAVNSRLVDAQVMNSALLSKANATSEALVKDMQQIRANSDYMRLRIG